MEERSALLEGLDQSDYQVSAGGSLSNTLVALSRLGAAAHHRGDRQLRVAFGGLVGSDALGKFYQAQMDRSGVAVLSQPVPHSNTGGWVGGPAGCHCTAGPSGGCGQELGSGRSCSGPSSGGRPASLQ